MTWHHTKNPSKRTTPSRRERGLAPELSIVPYDEDIVTAAAERARERSANEARAERSESEAATRLASLTEATRMIIGPDTEWGPARRRGGLPESSEFYDALHLATDPTESGNAD